MLATASVISNFDLVQKKIETAALRAGRNPKEVEVIAVTKYADPKDILSLLKQNKLTHIGETRLQDALKRWNQPDFLPYKNRVKKHFIGHLQSNKAGKAVEFFNYIDSVDNIEIARILDNKAGEADKKLSVLVQIKFTQKETQSGIETREASELVKEISKMQNLIPCGYMAIAPMADNPQKLRPVFKQAKKMFDSDFPGTHTRGQKNYLSLGMTSDFEIAIEEGANLVRIGSAIFNA
jgi:pyridoxal phosphate enzyme (YggS family)